MSNTFRDAFPFCEYYTANEIGSLFQVEIGTSPSTPLTIISTYGMITSSKFEPMVQLSIRFVVPEGMDPRTPLIKEVKVMTDPATFEPIALSAINESLRHQNEEEGMPPPPPPPPAPDIDVRVLLGCE